MNDPRRNVYKNDVDFATLALQDEEFAKYLKTNGQLDFTDPDAVRQLTKSLLHRDFEVDVDLPDDRLCPPLPNRLNYVLWVQDLVDCTENGDNIRKPDPDRRVVGIDIGTGASCIYPLLACAQRPSWNMAATDIDDKNVRYARHNVQKNKLDERIQVVQTTGNDPLIPIPDKIPIDSAEFTMCNPPFYKSRDEMMTSAKAKSRPPFSACTGAMVEMVTPGGEVAFVNRIINESMVLRDKVQWYSTMLGKLSSVIELLEKLKEVGNENYAVTDLVQGNKTKRWAIAWSWRDWRPNMAVGRNSSSIPKHLLPFPTDFSFNPPSMSADAVIRTITFVMDSLDVHWQWDAPTATGTGFSIGNVWARRARRKQARPDEAGSGSRSGTRQTPSSTAVTLGFTVSVHQRSSESVAVVVRWVKGLDHVLFESLCGMLKRKVQDGVSRNE